MEFLASVNACRFLSAILNPWTNVVLHYLGWSCFPWKSAAPPRVIPLRDSKEEDTTLARRDQ
jgi:hypothetical protein